MTEHANVRAYQVEVRDDGPVIRATVSIADCTPQRALSAFTDPAMLARWWGGELTVDLVEGGAYSVWFPKVPATMVGSVLGYTPGSSFEFSWGWDYKPDAPPRSVSVTASADGSGGTQLTIVHGPHGSGDEEATARAEHWAGWEYFLPRLPDAVAG